MSTTLWLCDHNWEQRCEDCSFYPCVNATDDPSELNDCDQFCVLDYEWGDDE